MEGKLLWTCPTCLCLKLPSFDTHFNVLTFGFCPKFLHKSLIGHQAQDWEGKPPLWNARQRCWETGTGRVRLTPRLVPKPIAAKQGGAKCVTKWVGRIFYERHDGLHREGLKTRPGNWLTEPIWVWVRLRGFTTERAPTAQPADTRPPTEPCPLSVLVPAAARTVDNWAVSTLQLAVSCRHSSSISICVVSFVYLLRCEWAT